MNSGYTQGFNHGYILASKNPKLLEMLKHNLKDKDLVYYEALKAGEKQLNKEREKELIKLQTKSSRNKKLER